MLDSSLFTYQSYEDNRVKTKPGFSAGTSGHLLVASGKKDGDKYLVKHIYPHNAANEYVACWLAGKLGVPTPKAWLLTPKPAYEMECISMKDSIDSKKEEMDKVLSDIADYLKKSLSKKGIILKDCNEPEEIILNWRRIKDKTISTKKRRVEISKSLQDKMETHRFEDGEGNVVSEQEGKEICELIKDFEIKFRNGEDVNNHLSKGIFRSEEDTILNYWNLRHLHLSSIETDVDYAAMSHNRSAWLLFCLVTDDSVFFVDVIHHPHKAGFTAFAFLETIQQNGWMETIGFVEDNDAVPSSRNAVIRNNEDIFTMYKCHINLTFELSGKVYIPINGVTCGGYATDITLELNQFKRLLKSILNEKKYICLSGDSQNVDTANLLFEDRNGGQRCVLPLAAMWS